MRPGHGIPAGESSSIGVGAGAAMTAVRMQHNERVKATNRIFWYKDSEKWLEIESGTQVESATWRCKYMAGWRCSQQVPIR